MRMRRRLLTAALALWPAARLFAQPVQEPQDKASADDPQPRPRHRISAAELHAALAARLPARIGVAGLLELQLGDPRLLLLPARNQLGAALVAQASGPGLQPSTPGELDLVFGVRYERSDRSIRAHQPELLALRLPGLPAEAVQAAQGLVPALARDLVGEVVLHRFSARELALPDTMGLEPEQAVVADDGLLVLFAPKRR